MSSLVVTSRGNILENKMFTTFPFFQNNMVVNWLCTIIKSTALHPGTDITLLGPPKCITSVPNHKCQNILRLSLEDIWSFIVRGSSATHLLLDNMIHEDSSFVAILSKFYDCRSTPTKKNIVDKTIGPGECDPHQVQARVPIIVERKKSINPRNVYQRK